MSRPLWSSRPNFREIDADFTRLADRTSVLPRVEADGSSPCPFAGQLFEAAAKAFEKAKEDKEYLRQDLDDAFAAKRKAKADIDAAWVQMGLGEMSLDEYEAMLPKLKGNVQSEIEHITSLENKLAECEKALEKARPRIEKGAHFLQ